MKSTYWGAQRRSALSTAQASAGALAIAMMLSAAPAFAQTAPAADAVADAPEEIIVTGIRGSLRSAANI